MIYSHRKLSICILTLGFLLIPQFASAALSDNIAAYWKLDEGTASSTADATTNANNGTLVGAASWVSGFFGNAVLTANSPIGYINVPYSSSLDITGDLTISVWLTTTAVNTGSDGIVSKWDAGSNKAYILWVTSTNIEFGGTTSGSTVYTNGLGAINGGGWHHLVVTRSGQTATIYVDGVQKQQTTAAGNVGSSVGSGSLNIGSYDNNAFPPSGFPGTIDEVGIWSRALSASDVAQLYNNGSGLAYPFTVTPSRKLMLFEGYRIKLVSGTLKLYQK